MKRLRYGLSALFFFLYGFFALVFAPVMILPVWTERGFRRMIRIFYRSFVFLAGLAGLYRVRMDAATRAALRGCRGRIVVMNHVSLIDICVILAQLPDSTAIAKSEVLKNPALAIVAKKMFLVNGEDPVKMLERTKKLLASGVNIVIFPQGTRGGKKLHRGAARLALALGAEVLPVRIAYDPVILAKGMRWYYAGEKTIGIGLEARPVIKPEGASDFHHAKALTNEFSRQLGIPTCTQS